MKKHALVLFAAALAACSSTSTTPASDAGSDAPGEGGGNTYTQTGRIVDYNVRTKGVAGVTVTAGTATATTDAKGMYALNVPKDTPFSMVVSAPSYLKLLEQEWKLNANADRGDTLFVDVATEQALQNALAGYDSNLAVLSVLVKKKAPCATVDGAVIAMANQGSAVLKYFKGGFPSNTATSVLESEFPSSAVIYNLPPGTPVQLTVTHPTCTQVAFPVEDPEYPHIVYTGNVTTESGLVASYTRIYVE